MATTFTNQATLSYNGSTVQSNIAVGMIEGALSVSKQAVAQQYSAGDEVTYIISIVNNGENAASGLTVTDNLGEYAFGDGTLRPLSYVDGSLQYYSNGALQPDAEITETDADGLVISGISVPADGNVTLVYSAEVNGFAPLEAGASVTNTATVTGAGICEVSAEENIAAVTEAELSIVKSVTPIPVAENGELTYTIQLQNTGNTAVTADDNAVISDTFDPLLTDISATLNGEALTAAEYNYDEATGVFSTADGVLTIPAATYEQNPDTGEFTVTPGSATLTVTGTVGTVCDITAG